MIRGQLLQRNCVRQATSLEMLRVCVNQAFTEQQALAANTNVGTFVNTPTYGAVSMTATGTIYTLNSLSIDVGDWDLSGTIISSISGVGSTFNGLTFGFSVVRTTLPLVEDRVVILPFIVNSLNSPLWFPLPVVRYSVEVPTIIYMNASVTSLTGLTMSTKGLIRARQVG